MTIAVEAYSGSLTVSMTTIRPVSGRGMLASLRATELLGLHLKDVPKVDRYRMAEGSHEGRVSGGPPQEAIKCLSSDSRWCLVVSLEVVVGEAAGLQ